MLYITGDVHADMKEFESRDFAHIRKNDCIIVCGDFGILWRGGRDEEKSIKAVGRRKYSTLFVDGAHENFDLLSKYPESEWNGGRVQVLSRNLMHLCRGQVYEIDGKKIFTFGGGESPDRELREEHVSWWPQEMPTQAEMDEGLKNLERCGWSVDYIVTYDAPSAFKMMIEGEHARPDALNVYLDRISEKCSYEKWFFGCYHKNQRLSQNTQAVFNKVIRPYEVPKR
jgi:hypothetical protein